jgi:hypothetical protein
MEPVIASGAGAAPDRGRLLDQHDVPARPRQVGEAARTGQPPPTTTTSVPCRPAIGHLRYCPHHA